MAFVDDGLRKTTVLTSADFERNLEFHIQSMTPDERSVFMRMLEDPVFAGEFLSVASAAHYSEEPLGIREWLSDPYYMGEASKDLYGHWKKDLVELFESQQYSTALVAGSTGCLRGSSLIWTDRGRERIDSIDGPRCYLSWHQKSGRFLYRQGTAPFLKGREALYTVQTDHGQFVSTGQHLIFSDLGTYQSVESLVEGQRVFYCGALQVSYDPPRTSSDVSPKGSLEDDLRWLKTRGDLKDRYLACCRRCDPQLLLGADTVLGLVPLQGGALECDQSSFLEGIWHKDAPLALEQVRSHLGRWNALLSMQDCDSPAPHLSCSEEDLVLVRRVQRSLLQALPFLRCTCTDSVRQTERESTKAGSHLVRCEACAHGSQAWLLEGRILEQIVELNESVLRKVQTLLLQFSLRWQTDARVPQASNHAFSCWSSVRLIQKSYQEEPYWDVSVIETNNYVHDEGFVSHNSGKSTFASFAILYQLYCALCLKDPQRSYGIAAGTQMYFVNLADKEQTARKAVFESVVGKLKLSRWFMERYPPLNKITDRFASNELRFKKGLSILAGSSTQTAFIGLNVLGGFVDELNFFQKAALSRRHLIGQSRYGIEGKAGEIFDGLMRRIKSRFQKRGRLPCVLIGASSKTSENAIMERFVIEAIARGDETVFIRDRNLIELRRDEFQAKTFRVLVGTQYHRSRILEAGEPLPESPDGRVLKVVEIPEDFRREFENDCDASLRDLAGIATHTIAGFMSKPEAIQACIDKERVHPFRCWKMQNFGDWDSRSKYTMDWGALAVQVEGGEWRPRYFPDRPRRVHMDPALTGDAFGLAVGCISHLQEVRKQSDDTELGYYVELQPVFHIDFILRIIGSKTEEILFRNVRQLLYAMSDKGFYPSCVSMDTFQSREMKQQLESQGINCDIISVDESMEPYLYFRQAVYENRVRFYRHDKFIDEMSKVVDTGKKVDHLPGDSKDLCDAVCGLLANLSADVGSHGVSYPILGISEYVGGITDAQADPGSISAVLKSKPKEEKSPIVHPEGAKVYEKNRPKNLKPTYTKKSSEEGSLPEFVVG